ncbi:MAG: VOC family protein, partial [Verrucomicrobiales bacterium]|nr:VOC family protein [Verrucomicrobiales bacterium]
MGLGQGEGMEARITIVTLGVADVDRSIRFYRDGLGFSTQAKAGDPIAFFATEGVRLAVYPREKLAEDIGVAEGAGGEFGGITLAHNVRRKEQVEQVLALAERSGGRVV